MQSNLLFGHFVINSNPTFFYYTIITFVSLKDISRMGCLTMRNRSFAEKVKKILIIMETMKTKACNEETISSTRVI